MTSMDKKIAVIVLLLAVLMGVGVLYWRYVTPSGQQATILVDNRPVETVVLDPALGMRQVVVQGVRGETVIEIDGPSIRIIASDCPDKLCIKMGRKSRPGEVIVCLPNRVVIRIDGNEQ
ncbi:MAG: NusG domain II-containing protein [Peptococcaceae bacterium]|nr:NusG domain II-containing protein [Peptococcaceae bacterium]